MFDRVIALLAFVTLVAFLAVFVRFVPEIDLIIVLLIGVALVAFDLFGDLIFKRKNKK